MKQSLHHAVGAVKQNASILDASVATDCYDAKEKTEEMKGIGANLNDTISVFHL